MFGFFDFPVAFHDQNLPTVSKIHIWSPAGLRWVRFGGAGRLGETPVQDPWHENVTLCKRRPGEAPDAAVADIAGQLRQLAAAARQ